MIPPWLVIALAWALSVQAAWYLGRAHELHRQIDKRVDAEAEAQKWRTLYELTKEPPCAD